MGEVGVGLIGSGFIAEIHAQALRSVPGARLSAVASPGEGRAAAFAGRHAAGAWFTDYRRLLECDDVHLVSLCLPNDLHCEAALAAAAAGKHVLCEKPLCVTLAEADRMIAACRAAGVQLMYAEELCFTPKYVRAKELVDSGALGRVYLVKQSEKHDGPHAPWFWDVERSGGGVTLDMGCHAIEFIRWILDRRPIRSVTAHMGTYVHGDKTRGDDNALLILEFDGAMGIAEESWSKPGGMDDRAEIHGSEGVTYADLLHGSSLETYSRVGYGYAVEKAGDTRGWSFTMFEELWNYGFPQELGEAVSAVRERRPFRGPTGEDGREVLRAIYAAYESAGTGRRIAYPYDPPAWAAKPIHGWKPPAAV